MQATNKKTKVTFTIGRVEAFQCEPGKQQSFLWDTEAPGLGLRATAKGAKTYIFQAKLNGRTIRLAIGSPRTILLDAPRDDRGRPSEKGARQEARRLKLLIDEGRDPRLVRQDELAAEQRAREARQAEEAERLARQARDAVTLGQVWGQYVAERKALWSALHLRDHLSAIQPGGVPRKRSKKLTEPGPLAALAEARLVDLTAERIEGWAKTEVRKRPTRARLALRLLKACLFWCTEHPVYGAVCQVNVARNKKARETLGKPRPKHDVLQREQLAAWFSAVRQIANPVIAAYLQCLLLLGCRRQELAALRWEDVDFQWRTLRLSDKVEEFRRVPLTPYVAHLLAALPRRGDWVFASAKAKSGHITEPSIAHRQACTVAGLQLTLHGLRRSFATLSEWTETPAGVAAQIQGHAPQGVREQNYIRRPIDLLRRWHDRIEAWMLGEAGVAFQSTEQALRLVKSSSSG